MNQLRGDLLLGLKIYLYGIIGIFMLFIIGCIFYIYMILNDYI